MVLVLGPRYVLIQAVPKGPTWKRHFEQLRPRHGVDEDDDPGMVSGPTPTFFNNCTSNGATPEKTQRSAKRTKKLPAAKSVGSGAYTS